MRRTKSKLLYLFIAVSALLIFSSCGDGDAGRQAFSPENGEYEIMLTPEEWTEISGFNRYSDSMAFSHTPSGAIISVDCYKKTNASEAGISDLDGFVTYFRELENAKELYESGTDIKIGDLTNIEKKDIKKSVATSGKRQVIQAQLEEASTGNKVAASSEVIYLESKNHYFVVYYSNVADKFESAQAGASDLIAHIKKEQ